MKKVLFTTISLILMAVALYGQNANWLRNIVESDFTQPIGVDVGDFNNDGYMDIIASDHSPEKYVWYENNQQVPVDFIPHIITGPHSWGGYYEVVAIDIDNNGTMDFIAAEDENECVSIWNNDGYGDFTRGQLSLDDATDIDVKDIDVDGDLDIVAGGRYETVWFEQVDTNIFTKHIIFNNHNTIKQVYATDLNNDSYLDIIVTDPQYDSVKIFRYDSIDDSVILESVITDINNPTDINSADLNKDGMYDIILTCGSTDSIIWLDNHGNFSFLSKYIISDDIDWPYQVRAIDIDNDSDLDIVSGCYTTQGLYWFRNDGLGLFSTASKQIIDDQVPLVHYISSYDFNNDGHTDIVAAGDNGVSWWENPGFDYVYFPSISANPCDSCNLDYSQQPVMCNLSQSAIGASVPFKISDNVEICGISYEGLITEDWEYNLEVINDDSGYVQVALANSHGEIIPEDTTTLFYIQFTSPRLCNENYFIDWDTALAEDTLRSLRFTDTSYYTFYPFTDYYLDSTEILGYIPGDANNSGGEPDISDISRIIDFLYLSHNDLCIFESTDPNGDCKIDISDITILIGYLYLHSVTELRCGCSEVSLAAYKPALPSNSVISKFDNGWTYITLIGSEDYPGLHLELTGNGTDSLEILLSDEIEMFYSIDSNLIKIGLFDMEGQELITSGSQPVIKLEGEYEIVNAVASNKAYQSVSLAVNPAAGDNNLPTDFALYQNFPNPFNPVTEISFDLPHAGDVKLEIFNIMGQKVTTLIDQGMGAGHHTAIWDASNQASGIYFYRITTGDINETKKMILLK